MGESTDAVILEMRNISKAFGGVQALSNVSFACRRGTVHALVGENGAGKSTLIKILAGAYPADAGELIYQGKRYTNLSAREALDKGIRIIYQDLNLVPYMTVAENIFLGREPCHKLGLIDAKRLRAQAEELLERLGVELDVRTPVGELTVASQQMVEIAKALSQNADLIVMDEPSAILAGHELERLFAMVDSLVKQGVTIVYISHRLDEVFEIADEITVLKDGVVVDTCSVKEIDRAGLVHMMVGRELAEVFPPPGRTRGEVVLAAENITTDAIKHTASLRLHAGEILGLAGMVGSGRTELARALFGVDPLRSGRITLNGKSVNINTPSRAVQAGLALVPEDRKSQGLFMGLPIRNNITIAILGKLSQHGLIHRRREAEAIERARRSLSIHMSSIHQEAQYLSGGNQQKVVLARWLATLPSVVILDEPTRGIDVGAKFEIYRLVRELTDGGVAVLMISSELPEILGMSDRILVMRDGRIAGELSREEATEEKIVELATTGQALGEVI
jgi:ribose transport system ATP-binding protein